MPNTAGGLPYPAGSDAPDVPGDMQALAEAVDSTKIPYSIVNAKGDLIAATANDTITRLGVGTDGQVLTASSGAASGLAWTTFVSGVQGVTLVRLTSGTSWSVPSNITTASIFCIGGGGGGGGAANAQAPGGGGAGGLACGVFDLTSARGTSISYAIGGGGSGGNTSGTQGSNGGNTTFGTVSQPWYLLASGGGGGGAGTGANGSSGGCGGGRGLPNTIMCGGGGGIAGPGVGSVEAWGSGAAFSAQGTQGGNGGPATNVAGATPNAMARGGPGMNLFGYFVGGGGDGASHNGSDNTSVWGGGRSGISAGSGGNGTANTGGGGGAGYGNFGAQAGGSGGSGVIFILYYS